MLPQKRTHTDLHEKPDQFEIIHFSQDIRNWKSNLGVESWLFFNDSRLLTPKNPQTPDSDSQAHLTTAKHYQKFKKTCI